jgi:hypothetical protein
MIDMTLNTPVDLTGDPLWEEFTDFFNNYEALRTRPKFPIFGDAYEAAFDECMKCHHLSARLFADDLLAILWRNTGGEDDKYEEIQSEFFSTSFYLNFAAGVRSIGNYVDHTSPVIADNGKVTSHTLCSPKPSEFDQKLLALSIPKDRREGIIGDMLERFSSEVESLGEYKARQWYRKQVRWEFLCAVWRWISSASTAAWIYETIRQRIG